MANSFVGLASFALLLVASFSFVDAVKDKYVDIRLEVGKPYFTAHYKEAGAKKDAKPPVLVLHAGHYSSEKWQETGTIDALTQAGAYVVAVDLPSYGKTGGEKLFNAEDRVKFLQAFLAAVKLEKSTAAKIYSWVFPNSELTIFENGGINCYLEEPEKFNDVVVNFYQSRL
ncbi:hypothetical protein CYMTET_54978 [Cymbomonas tetramitiformis]|uniref:AB hydrolase-1 domain-containing protein n=1 Tax=Cymbomonas tetramitiformis TaxID=36881 RepID=A0AAE0BF12_9CHLO|nr:hypothetical protein CYMTET_54978 [Cymbomonas tetramitiformis]